MRSPTRPRIRRRWFLVGAAVLLLIISVSSIVRFYTDLLWFHEVGFGRVFWTVFWSRAATGVVGALGAGLVVYLNLEVARRSAPTFRFVGGTDLTEQYRSAFRPYARLANFVVAAVVAFFTGLSTSAAWQRYLLWRHAQPFGIEAPKPFGHDVSFYVFSIPFQRTLLSWLFGMFVVSLVLSLVAHLFNGSIQMEPNRVRVAPVVKAHVSALLGIIALLKAWAYRLDTFDLVFSPRGAVTGASYTDVHVQRPAFQLLFFIAVIVAVLFFVNVVRFRGWLLPGAALGVWAFASIVLGAIVPAAVQRFEVKPNESQRERPYIRLNIVATRRAFNLDRIDVRRFDPQMTLSAADVAANQGTVRNVRVWDPSVLDPTFQRLQAIRSYYAFDDVDIDRYQIDGKPTQVMLSGREVDTSKLDPGSQNWVNTRLTYTHGYGIVATPANAVTEEGLPDFIVQGLPPQAVRALRVRQAGLYYGTRFDPNSYAVVDTKQREIDYATGEQRVVTTTYKGSGGVPLSNALRRLAFALRFGDTDLFISKFITPRSRVIMRRNIVERASAAAPFLQYDSDPYLVAANHRLYWMLDAYTATDRFPYSQRIDLSNVNPAGFIGGRANYMRNSVKVVIDAYTGKMHFYVIDSSDPLARTYQLVFPTLFTSGTELPAVLRAHLRYPEDLFKVQALQYRLYHITDPQRLYEREDVWDIANDPTSGQTTQMAPYYVMMKLPGESHEEFLLFIPFTPRGKPNLNGWLAARMDPGHYGEMIAFSLPRGITIDGPENVYARINQTDRISSQFTLWDQAGSRVIHGNILVIPMARTLMFVEPIYLASQQETNALPELRRVIVVVGDRIGFQPTVDQSLAEVVGAATTAPSPASPQPPPSPGPSSAVSSLLEQALRHFDAADAALRSGDLAGYQRETKAAQQLVEQAAAQQSGR